MTKNKPTQEIEINILAENNYTMKGNLVFSTINKATLSLLNFQQAPSAISIDLAQVGKIDSAGLALLIEWIKFSRAHQVKLSFINIPAQLIALAKLSYIEETDLFTT